jgi:hypothetical protein
LTGGRKYPESVRVTQECIFYEPFSYWDWHGVLPDDVSAFEERKQLLCERRGRGFTTGDGRRFGSKTPREAWRDFQGRVDSDPAKSQWVKKIAVASWMTVDDMDWYVAISLLVYTFMLTLFQDWPNAGKTRSS